MKAKVAILISGRGSNMAALLYAAKHPDCAYAVCLVASNDPAAAGLELAHAEGIATFCHPHKGISRAEHDAIMHEAITAAGAQYIALAGYMRILSDPFVQAWQGRMLNIHPSLLPKYKGLHTHQRALDAGDSHCGCSVHLVTPELDDGPVLGQTKVVIRPNDTVDDLIARVLFAEHQLYPKTLHDYVAREANPDWLIARVSELALALPETEARPSHGSAGWRVGGATTGKYFAYVSVHHHGEETIALLVKTSGADEQAALIDQDPEIYYLPKFYAPSGWIAIRLDTGRTDWRHINYWLARSWRAVAPKRLTKMIDVAAEF